MNRPVLALATTIALASAVHIAQRHLQHRQSLELAVHQAHGRMLEVATTQTDLDPIWVHNHPDHVKDDESGPLLMCQWWLEFWRTGLNLGVFTPAVLRQNARNFMQDPTALKAWALTRHGRALQPRGRWDRMHVALLNAAFEEAGGPAQYPELELPPPRPSEARRHPDERMIMTVRTYGSPPAPVAPGDHRSRALLLDLDGVLLDTRPVMRKAWQRVQEIHGVALPFRDYERHLGREFGDIMQRLGVTDAEAVRQTYEAESVASAHLADEFAGIVETLHAFVAADWRLGVVTSKHVDRAAPLLARLGCPFATIRTPAGAGRTKPAPDPLLLALVDLGVDPAAAVYVGDMAVDQEAAARAGVPYVHAAWGYGQPTAPDPETASSPRELLSLLLPAKQLVEGSTV